MKEILSVDEINHVSRLARLKLNEDEILKYRKDLAKLLNDIDKILDVEVSDSDILISPWGMDCTLREDKNGEMLSSLEVLKNAPRHNGNYIEVPVVINE